MDLIRSAADLARLDTLRGVRPLVFVPTMGALHDGHLSLIRYGAELGPVVVSIFVNPTQFGPNEDYDAYPRDLDRDLALLKPLNVAAVFNPPVQEVYGQPGGVTIQPGQRGTGLCGADRPGHFCGVLTVVAKLFGLVNPDVAIFGRKDAQQCLVIGQMVDDLKMSVRLIDAPTVREPDGLAMSSRNRYLSDDQRRQALCLSRALQQARVRIEDGERSVKTLIQAMTADLQKADAVEYAEVRSVPDLMIPETVSGRTLLAVAAQVGPARLIDNLVLDIQANEITDSCLLDTGRDLWT